MGANRQPVIGHIDCPVCGFSEMQIKNDKNGDASGYCPDCSQQLFTRNPHKSSLLMKRVRLVAAGAAPADLAPQASAPVAVPVFLAPQVAAPKPAPAVQAAPGAANAVKVGGSTVQPGKTAQKPVKSVEPEAPAAGGWWAPVLGKSARKGAPA